MGILLSIVRPGSVVIKMPTKGKLGPEKLFHSIRIFLTLSGFGGNQSNQGMGKSNRNQVK